MKMTANMMYSMMMTTMIPSVKAKDYWTNMWSILPSSFGIYMENRCQKILLILSKSMIYRLFLVLILYI